MPNSHITAIALGTCSGGLPSWGPSCWFCFFTWSFVKTVALVYIVNGSWRDPACPGIHVLALQKCFSVLLHGLFSVPGIDLPCLRVGTACLWVMPRKHVCFSCLLKCFVILAKQKVTQSPAVPTLVTIVSVQGTDMSRE